jgi:hypothetical protein
LGIPLQIIEKEKGLPFSQKKMKEERIFRKRRWGGNRKIKYVKYFYKNTNEIWGQLFV